MKAANRPINIIKFVRRGFVHFFRQNATIESRNGIPRSCHWDNRGIFKPWEKSNPLSQTIELTRVKARIKALTEKIVASGCTEAEAMSAAEMVGRLLERYALSMDEIEIRSSRCVQREVPLGGKRRRPIAQAVA